MSQDRESFYENTEPVDERLEALKQLYPEIFSDGKINLDAFKDATNTSDLPEGQDKTPGYYGLYWPGKRMAKQLAKKAPEGTLEPVIGDGVNEDSTHNIYIEGDNLEVLRILKQSYKGRIKMIYIDPPYNTGKDFIYPDDYTMPVDEYLKLTGQVDENGKSLVSNKKTSGAFHTKWLNMMYPRLQLARELLKDDGVIFISIDDNEQANLKLLCDDIFGEENFISTIAVKMSEPTGVKMTHAKTRLPKLKEFVLMYSKSENIYLKPQRIPKDKWDDEYKTFLEGISETDVSMIKEIRDKEFKDSKDIDHIDKLLQNVSAIPLSDLYKKNNLSSDEEKNKFKYENAWRIIRTVSTTDSAKQLADLKRNKITQTFFSINTAEDKIYFIKGDYNENNDNPRIKILFADDYLTVNPCDFWQDIKTTGLDNEGGVDFKNGKKPLKLLKRLIDMTTNDNDLILDFFSGSASTAEALLESNIENKTNKKFILVQLPVEINTEIEDDKKQAKKIIKFLDNINKDHNICELAKERIRIANNKIIPMQNNINNSNIGFKVYKLNKSNFVKYTPVKGQSESDTNSLFEQLEKQQTPLIDNYKPENLLTEIILRQGFALDCSIEQLTEYTENIIYKITDSNDSVRRAITLYICLDESLSENTVQNLKINDNEKFICLDSAIDDTNYARLCDKGRIETI